MEGKWSERKKGGVWRQKAERSVGERLKKKKDNGNKRKRGGGCKSDLLLTPFRRYRGSDVSQQGSWPAADRV